MRKSILFTMVLSLSLTLSMAQEVKFGGKAGINLATLQPDLNDPESRVAFHLGAVAEISILEAFSIQPELLYSAQGVKDKSDDDEIIKLDYLTVPLLAKYYVSEGFSLEAGPQLGFLLSAKGEDDGDSFDLKDITKSTDIGLALGLGYKMESGLNFAFRYYFGGDVNSLDDDPDKIKNNVFQFSVGYFFN